MKKLAVMYRILIAVLFWAFMCAHSNAQTSASNKAITVTYEGYAAGRYKLVVYNKQTCGYVNLVLTYQGISPTLISPTYNANDVTDAYLIGDSVVIYITGKYNAAAYIGVTATTNCGQGDNSCVTVSTSGALPVTFTSFSVMPLEPGYAQVQFTVASVWHIKEYRIMVSTDGITYKVLTVVNSGALSYSIKVKL